ncbi:MAG: BrnT family toxin [Acidobacteriota bacterium]
MDFGWDENKRTENIGKHELDFTDAWQFFDAPMLFDIDNRKDYGEMRFIGLGFLRNLIVATVFTEPNEETIRTISSRKSIKI